LYDQYEMISLLKEQGPQEVEKNVFNERKFSMKERKFSMDALWNDS